MAAADKAAADKAAAGEAASDMVPQGTAMTPVEPSPLPAPPSTSKHADPTPSRMNATTTPGSKTTAKKPSSFHARGPMSTQAAAVTPAPVAVRSEEERQARAQRSAAAMLELDAAMAVAEEEALKGAASAVKAAKEAFKRIGSPATKEGTPVIALAIPIDESRASRMARRRQLSQRWREQKRAEGTPRRAGEELPDAFASLP